MPPLKYSRELNPDVLLLQEIRDYDSCARLAEAISPGTYKVAICSAFKEPFQKGFGRQQVAILSKYSAQAAWAERWVSMEHIEPPRGFSFAWFKIRGTDLGVYSVHLKSNLIMRGDKKIETAKNISKREVAATQLVAHLKSVITTAIPNVRSVIIGGDFNTNQDQPMFASEETFAILRDAGFQNGMEQLPLIQRVTHPSSKGYPDATFDYLWVKNSNVEGLKILSSKVSDHYPVTCDIEIPSTPSNNHEPGSLAFSKVGPQRHPSLSTNDAQLVTIEQPVTIQIPYGHTILPRGMKLPIVSRDSSTVHVRYMGEVYPVALSATDLR